VISNLRIPEPAATAVVAVIGRDQSALAIDGMKLDAIHPEMFIVGGTETEGGLVAE